MKYRYLIEHNAAGDYDPVYMSDVDSNGERVGGGAGYPSVDAAKEAAQSAWPDETLKWKDPPKAWLPDAICVSQTVDDGVPVNRDA